VCVEFATSEPDADAQLRLDTSALQQPAKDEGARQAGCWTEGMPGGDVDDAAKRQELVEVRVVQCRPDAGSPVDPMLETRIAQGVQAYPEERMQGHCAQEGFFLRGAESAEALQFAGEGSDGHDV
jgi:hypothetical protein